MDYIKLNPQYTVRNEKGCSFIVKLEEQIDNGTKEISRDVSVVPSVVGFIVAEIGKDTITASLEKISLSLGIDIEIIKHFVNNLIGKRRVNLLIKSKHSLFRLICWCVVLLRMSENIISKMDLARLTNS